MQLQFSLSLFIGHNTNSPMTPVIVQVHCLCQNQLLITESAAAPTLAFFFFLEPIASKWKWDYVLLH